MNATRLQLGLLLSAPALATMAWILSDWRNFGWLNGHLRAESVLQAQTKRQGDLDQLADFVKARARTRKEVAIRLTRGELTLFEAAAWYRSLNEKNPVLNAYRQIYHGDSDEEKLCRQVIHCATLALQEEGKEGQAEKLGCWLELQLWQHVQKHGPPLLPDERSLAEPGLATE